MSVMAIASNTQQPAATTRPDSREITAENRNEIGKKNDKADGVQPKPAVPDFDEYVHIGEAEVKESVGIYGIGKDEHGDPKIVFDDPDKQIGAEDEAPKDEEPKEEICTVNTDKVDAEIKQLKDEQQKIQQQLNQASNNPEKRADLERKLAHADTQLAAKDNDAYRKQNATVTNGGIA